MHGIVAYAYLNISLCEKNHQFLAGSRVVSALRSNRSRDAVG